MISESQGRELRQQLIDSVSDVVADPATTLRLIEQARRPAAPRRARRDWLAPLLAGAAVIVVALTVVVAFGSRHDGHRETAPIASASQSATPNTSPAPSRSAAPSVASKSAAPEQPFPGPSTSTPTRPSPTPNVLVLGPTGLGQLQLGMTRAQALATGLIKKFDPGNTAADHCEQAELFGQSSWPGQTSSIYLEGSLGVSSIFPPTNVKTAEGIGAGSTIAQLRRAYPSANVDPPQQASGTYVPVPGNPKAEYQIFVGPDDRVSAIVLLLKDQGCFG